MEGGKWPTCMVWENDNFCVGAGGKDILFRSSFVVSEEPQLVAVDNHFWISLIFRQSKWIIQITYLGVEASGEGACPDFAIF